MARVVLTVAASRVLRMACFMATVLPNPRPGCYRRRFPPVPPGLWDTIKLGYTTIRGFGGCNDLIFSGHGAFWVLAPLAFRTYYPGHRLSTWVLWLALAHACVKDVVDEQHYSVVGEGWKAAGRGREGMGKHLEGITVKAESAPPHEG
ncbi:hypothetical protein Vretimale_1112 [Volvox reticuliferus]|uniref:Sphingomyelin synthase-like domain-containing protein n=1 Tax=Volvox reticuliferus TaxID=1737510 RepID=A0A8J4D4L9_9CHLO|nr:hypothetical protein Vretimale_1112 [Volvox reticuliferus]